MTENKCCNNVCNVLNDIYKKTTSEHDKLSYIRAFGTPKRGSLVRQEELSSQASVLEDMIGELTARNICKCIDLEKDYTTEYRTKRINEYRNAPQVREDSRIAMDKEIKDLKSEIIPQHNR